MKFDVKNATSYIFKDKKLGFKFLAVSLMILFFLFFGFIRSYFISYLYFDNLEERMYLAVSNFAPKSLYSFLAFPNILPYSITFDISQLSFGKMDLYRIGAIATLIVSFLAAAFPIGYFVQNSHNRILYNNIDLPELKYWKDFFKTGLKFIAGVFLVSLPLLIVNLALMQFIVSYCAAQADAYPDLAWLFMQARPFMVILSYLVISIILFFYLAVAVIPFLCSFKFNSFFKFRESFKMIFKNFKAYAKYTGFLILFNLILLVPVWLVAEFSKYQSEMMETSQLCVNLIGIGILLPLVFWVASTTSDFQSQFAKSYLEKKENKEI